MDSIYCAFSRFQPLCSCCSHTAHALPTRHAMSLLEVGPTSCFELCVTQLTTLYTSSMRAYHGKVYKMWTKGGVLRGNPGMDGSIMIIASPMISCMMAYRSVTRMWMICVNSKVGSLGYVEDFEGNKTWLARLVVCQNMHPEFRCRFF